MKRVGLLIALIVGLGVMGGPLAQSASAANRHDTMLVKHGHKKHHKRTQSHHAKRHAHHKRKSS